jgi:hypothetical protein
MRGEFGNQGFDGVETASFIRRNLLARARQRGHAYGSLKFHVSILPGLIDCRPGKPGAAICDQPLPILVMTDMDGGK